MGAVAYSFMLTCLICMCAILAISIYAPVVVFFINRIRIRPLVAWYDMWIGVYVDRPGRRIFICPVPCVGIVIELK